MESFGVRFGRLTRDKRGIEGWSQDDLALKSGLTKARISDIETGKINNPQVKTVDALCVALNISREEREACHLVTGPRLPPHLLENLALRFGYSTPNASEGELEDFLKEKAIEFRELQERLAQMTAAEGRMAAFLAAATAALEQGDFQLADKHLAEAEDAQLASATLPALESQYRLRFERGNAALLGGGIRIAAQHWETTANYFHFIDKEIEAEKRYEYSTQFRYYGYRYRNVDALYAASDALEKNLNIWCKEDDPQNWCRATNALGVVYWRLSQFDAPEKSVTHIIKAKSIFLSVRESCSETNLIYYFVASGINLSNIYLNREIAASDEDYYKNLETSLGIQSNSLGNYALDLANAISCRSTPLRPTVRPYIW